MPVRPVLTLPHDVLVTPARPVGRTDAETRALATDLVDTMEASPGCVGLAAPQIGVELRAFVVDVTGHRSARSCHGTFVLFDPVVEALADTETAREGCMSVPDLTGDVARATRVTVSGNDADGRRRRLEVDAFEARAVLHEMDHLDGLVFLDRVTGPHGVFPRKVYR
ncbi:MAG TPA: peptide deformylase [Acidimicrobiales bacterium]|jgi:peptide deformylase|nr:peptide deformylase [Acidimicrobiales bacterium]